jgi:hypothetical protein
MWMMLLACAIGQPDPAADGSPSAQAATQAQTIADKAGAIANTARELEQMSDPARERVAEGEDPRAHMKRMREKMAQIEALEAELQAEVEAFEAKLSAPR